MRVIPAIDLKDGECVRLLQGDFERATHYSDDPVAIARQFAALNVTDLHVVDLDGARTGASVNGERVAAICNAADLSVQVGGGIRRRSDVDDWLARGVSRCVIGSTAIRDPASVLEWIGEFGGAAIVLALDVRIDEEGVPRLTTDGWTRTSQESLWECLDTYADAGALQVLCTDVARDGAMQGPNLDLYRSILARYPGIRLQASGGVRDAADLQALARTGCPAAITGRALLDGAITAEEIATFRQSA